LTGILAEADDAWTVADGMSGTVLRRLARAAARAASTTVEGLATWLWLGAATTKSVE